MPIFGWKWRSINSLLPMIQEECRTVHRLLHEVERKRKRRERAADAEPVRKRIREAQHSPKSGVKRDEKSVRRPCGEEKQRRQNQSNEGGPRLTASRTKHDGRVKVEIRKALYRLGVVKQRKRLRPQKTLLLEFLANRPTAMRRKRLRP